MRLPFIVTALILSFAAPAAAASITAASINQAIFDGSQPASEDTMAGAVVRAQVLLDRARFSPGEIDGRLGENARKALKAFAAAKSLGEVDAATPELWRALEATSQEPAIVAYRISQADLKGPFVKKIPAKMEAMKSLPYLGYTSPREALAEKFHMSEELLAALNPGKTFARVGEELRVANVARSDNKVQVARIEVEKSGGTLKAFNAQGALVAFFPATVGSEEKPAPSGTLKVVSSDAHPNYRYNPDYKFKGVKSKTAFTIKPGPNNPVGVYWIGLSAQGYGIHGTPEPAKVSKSASHGCVRLTNWDASFLGGNTKKGIPVTFVDGPTAAATSQN
jgi:lipoprotein-anchoring transpeptidase ErfK/SrfK